MKTKRTKSERKRTMVPNIFKGKTGKRPKKSWYKSLKEKLGKN